MRKNVTLSFANILMILLLTHCAGFAQWVRVNCPIYPETLIVKDGFLFAGSDGGVVSSSNNGVDWLFVNNGLSGDISPVSVRSLFSFGNYLLAGAMNMDGLYLSTNNGNSWMRHSDHGVEEVTSFTTHGTFIFAASSNTVVSRSSDSGNSWFMIDSGLTLNPFGLRTTSVSANSDFVFCSNDAGQIYRSTNGDRWSLIYQDPSYDHIYTVFANDTIIFAQFPDSMMRSLDNGDHWEVIKRGSFGANIFLANNNIVLAAGYFGIIYSLNNGDTWNSASDGLPDSVVIDALIIKDGYLYAGAYETLSFSPGGLWRRPLSDFTNDVKKSKQLNQSFTLFPNPASTQALLNFTLAKSGNVTIGIYDLLGRRMKQISLGEISVGEHSETLDLHGLADGTYLCKMITGGDVSSAMFTVVK